MVLVSSFKLSFASGKFFCVQTFDFLAFLSKSFKTVQHKRNPKGCTLERHEYDEYKPFVHTLILR